MTELLLLENLCVRLQKLFEGYKILDKAGVLSQVKIFAQYLPMARGLTVGRTHENYSESDYEKNFPCVVVKIGESIDRERFDAVYLSEVNVKLLIGTYDGVPLGADDEQREYYERRREMCQGYRDVLNIQEMIRQDFMIERVTGKRFRMAMPIKARLIESDTYPAYFGEMDLVFEVGAPVQKDFVYEKEMRL